jgi:hypothetical protein
MTELFKNFSKTADAIVDLAKQVPSQIVNLGEQVGTFVKGIDLTDVRSLPKQIKQQADKVDLNVKLTVPQAFTDRLGQVKVFAPIDVDAIQARVSDVGDYLQSLPSKISEVPGMVQEFVSELPDSATKLVSDTTDKARNLVEDLKNRPILFVPARKESAKKPAAAKKTTTKKATPKAAPAPVNGTDTTPTA